MLVRNSDDMQSSNPTQKRTNGECKTVTRTTRSHYREFLRGPTENMRKISDGLAADKCCSTFTTTFQQKSLQAEMTNFRELALLMSSEVITLKTAGNNVSKQINAKGSIQRKYVKRHRPVIRCNYTKRDISTQQKLSKWLNTCKKISQN